jgi:surface antigen Omp85-like protein/surface antigen-like variable number repeat protein
VDPRTLSPPPRSLPGALAGALLLAAARAQQGVEPPASKPAAPEWRVGKIRIETQDVFREVEAAENILFEAANFLHYTTREEVVAREVAVLVKEGDVYVPARAEELERNLRRLGFIAEARVEPVFQPDGTVDLHVRTRDQFTLRAGASGASFAGSESGRASIGEDNLFGWGKTLSFLYQVTPDVAGGELRYEDFQFLGTRAVFSTSLRSTDEGESLEGSLVRPFDTLATPWSYGVRAGHVEDEAEFFEAGEDVARVPRKLDYENLFLTRGLGPPQSRRLFGVSLLHERTAFGAPQGTVGDVIEVPGEIDSWRIGPTVSFRDIPVYRKRTFLDALGFVEDISTGSSIQFLPGFRWRAEKGTETTLEAVADAEAFWVMEPWGTSISVLRLEASGRNGEGGGRAWSAGGFLHHYETGLPGQTIAINLSADFVWEGEDLPVQLKLGEESGLRGYEARALAGTKRARFNVEDRIPTPLELWSFRLGLVAFFDAGTVWDRGESFEWSEVKKSLGVGFRLGSVPFLGRNVVRLDLAYPLDDVEGTSGGLTVTLTSGQAFTLFRNPEGLSKDF